MKIENVELDMMQHLYDKVTYVPTHAKGNAGHEDCERGVIIGLVDDGKHIPSVRILYCKSRTIQHTDVLNLVWG